MSNSLAVSMPSRSSRSRREFDPHEFDQEVAGRRHIEIVTTRAQRRARPRVVYAVIAVSGLFVILIAQLLLSIVVSNGAYQIADLQSTAKNLSRDQQTLTEALNVLESPQNLSSRAQQFGMVINSSSPGWLRLSDGKVLRAPVAAGAASTVTTGSSLIPNALVTPEVIASQGTDGLDPTTGLAPGLGSATSTTASGAAGTSVSGAPAASGTAGSVPSTTAPTSVLPAPTTH